MKRITIIAVLLMLIMQTIFPAISHVNAAGDFVIKDGVLTKYSGSGGDVEIPYGVVEIGFSAFNGSNITSIIIPNSVKNIGSFAFSDCNGLTSVDIPNSVQNIGANAFYRCENLKSITISTSVSSIVEGCFKGCKALTEINVDDNNAHYSSLSGVLFNKQQTVILTYPAGKSDSAYVIPDSVTYIGESAFSFSTLPSIVLPNSLKNIGAQAFIFCWELTSIDIPSGTTSIGGTAFQYCKNIESITIPSSVTSIGGGAFNGCSSLNSIVIPDGVTNLGNNTFDSCWSLTKAIIPNSVVKIGMNAFFGCENLTIYGDADSYAQSYAEQNGILFMASTTPSPLPTTDVKVTLNGEYIEFDQPPVIIDGRTLVPIRAVCEALGADVYWYEGNQTVIIIKNEIKLFIKIREDSFAKFIINSFSEMQQIESLDDLNVERIWIDVPPQIIGDRTLLPICAVCEALGAEVDWDGENNTVVITCSQELIDDKNRDITFFDEMMADTDEQSPKGTVANAKVKLGESAKFTETVIQQATDAVLAKFPDFIDCDLIELWYDEEKSNREIESYMTSGRGLINGVQKENVIVLFSNFNTGERSGEDGFNPNSHYTNWMWILIRDNANSPWRVDDWGY